MLLAMDTASSTASVAIYDVSRLHLLAEMSWEGRRRQTQDLLLLVRHLLMTAAVPPDALTALAVTTGPGSFTGVRIAISAAKGIGLGLPAVPAVIGVPTLCVTAAPWLPLAAASQPSPAICAVMQAGRGRYHWTFFTSSDRLHRPSAGEHATGTASELAEVLANHPSPAHWLAGEIDPELATAVHALAHVMVLDPIHSLRRAGILAHLAVAFLEAGCVETLASLQPLYLRAP